MVEYQIRDFTQDDEEIILNLYKIAFGFKLSSEAWKWRYLNGLCKPIVKLMFDDDKLIGHYAITPMPFSIKGENRKAAQAITLMVHPEYRKRGIFLKLAELTHKIAEENGIFAVYAFPFRNISARGFFGKLGWCRSDTLKVFSTDDIQNIKLPNEVNIKEPDFDDAYDVFWNVLKKRFEIIQERSKDMLCWRIADCPKLNNGFYKLMEIRDKSRLLGYLIYKLYKNDKQVTGHIMEIFGYDSGHIEILLRAALAYSQLNNVKSVTCWIYDTHSFRFMFEKYGFTMSSTIIPFGGNIFNLMEGEAMKKCLESWHVSMIDSDIF